MKLDIEEILQKAEGISLQIRSCKVSCSLIQELSATCHGLHQRMQSSHWLRHRDTVSQSSIRVASDLNVSQCVSWLQIKSLYLCLTLWMMSSPRSPQRLEVISIQHSTTLSDLMEAVTYGWKLRMNSAERKRFKCDRFQLVSKVDSKVRMDGSSACWVLQRNGLWRTELWSCEVWWVLMLVLCLNCRSSSSGNASFHQRHPGLRHTGLWFWPDRLWLSSPSQTDPAAWRLLQRTLERNQLSQQLQSGLHIVVKRRDWLGVSAAGGRGCKKDWRLFRILFL